MATRSSLRSALSRYVQGGTSETLGNKIGWWERTIFFARPDDITFPLTAKYHQRPDLLAQAAYGKASYMWLILQYNNILDVNTEFVEGKMISIPSPSRVAFEIG